MYGIHSATERYLLVCYTSLITLSSIFGDTLILIGSSKYNAIKLHESIVHFIQHIAVADLTLSFFRALPGAVSLAANGWILGDFLCHVAYFATYIPALELCQLVMVVALAKLAIVKYPLRTFHFSKRSAHLIACGIWLYSAIFPVAAAIKEKFDIYFSYLDYNCESYGQWKPVENLLFCVAEGFSILASTATTLVSSAMLIYLAKRVTERDTQSRLRWQGITTVLATVAVHTIATLPFGIYFLGCQFTEDKQKAFFQVQFYRYALYIALLDIVANFYKHIHPQSEELQRVPKIQDSKTFFALERCPSS